jgi:hypothetical protein
MANNVGFEVLTAVVMVSSISWNVMLNNKWLSPNTWEPGKPLWNEDTEYLQLTLDYMQDI